MIHKKKLCLLIPSLQSGGMERVMSELAGYFSLKPELEVHLIMYGMKPELFYSIPTNLKIHKPTFTFNDKYRTWNTIKTLLYLRLKINAINPDSILSFGEYWNSFVLIAMIGFKIPIFISDRCQPDKSLGKLHNYLRKVMYPHASAVIVQTEVAKTIYQMMLPKAKIITIANPIRAIEIDPILTRENIILTVGRLISTKHHDELIRLFAKIKLPGWKLVVVGGDALKQQNKQRLESLVSKLNASDKVILTGTRNDVDEFYKKSKIFALTSSSEGFPNVIGEAMSAGLPVVAFDCIAGPSDIIKNNKNGYLIPLFDYDSFQKKLQSLMENELLRTEFGENAKETIMDFSINAIGKRFYDVILNYKK